MVAAGAPPVPQGLSQLSRSANHNQGYSAVLQVDSDDEMLETEPTAREPTEAVDDGGGVISVAPLTPEGRPESEGPEGQADS